MHLTNVTIVICRKFSVISETLLSAYLRKKKLSTEKVALPTVWKVKRWIIVRERRRLPTNQVQKLVNPSMYLSPQVVITAIAEINRPVSNASKYLLKGVACWKAYVCPRMTHHMLSTLIPLIAVMAFEGTVVFIIRLVFWIKEKPKKNRNTTSAWKYNT